MALWDSVQQAICQVSNSLFATHGGHPRHPGALPWWSSSCRDALLTLRTAPSHDCQHARVALRFTIRDTKRSYFENLLLDPDVDLWRLASWHHGHRESMIHPLRLSDDSLSHDLTEMTQLFWDRFFALDTPTPTGPLCLPLDPPLLEFPPITADEVRSALSGTSASSAPGPSGISYPLVHWAFEASPEVFLLLWNSSLHLHFNPWGEAKVIVIPKPQKPDYALAKAYRPISLLECHSKLLQKIIASRLSSLDLRHNLLGPYQFGSRKFFSAPDAATFLRLKARDCISAN